MKYILIKIRRRGGGGGGKLKINLTIDTVFINVYSLYEPLEIEVTYTSLILNIGEASPAKGFPCTHPRRDKPKR